jgi:uncharacterized circularly permuted ATP-grasp superfamily protein/uncharacterized alpha-E superfamily protein
VSKVEPTAVQQLLDGYRPPTGVYDEVIAGPGTVRPFCAPLLRSLDALGRHELASRWENAKRAIRDNGVTYNVYGDPAGTDRPWTLDLMPLVISAPEWERIEAALVQRARLLNAVLSDLFGPQRLVHDGDLPPSLLFANPAFLRPCHGLAVPGGVYVHLLGVDLARAPDGEWRVLADRTQAPSGAGYALENRIVLSRNLPEAFRECHVQRLAAFFRGYRDGLAALAPPGSGQPRVVLLTPGPHNETYFEHAYLARYLGLTLVEGGDLTCRDCRVYIKTLDGLQPVDVIVRRLDDGFCDPLELRADSALGVPGLIEAVREGHVALANALGTGLVEAPAMAAFLPGFCRRLLGEELLISPAKSWWCGHPDDLAYVLEDLDDLVIKRAFPAATRQPIFGRSLTAEQLRSLRAAIRANPEDFVAQREVALSAAPAWTERGLEPRQLVLRAYVAAAGDSYIVMPGGLSRVAAAGDVPIVSMQRGGGSKDTWVIASGPVSAVSLLAPTRTEVQRERRAADLPSRVADNLFWIGRHAERAEQAVRVLRSFVSHLTREDTIEERAAIVALHHVLIDLGLLPPDVADASDDWESMLLRLFRADARPNTLRATLLEIRRVTMAVRDRLSLDTWRILGQLQQDFQLRHGRLHFDDVLMHLNRMITDLAAFSGMEMENMTRGLGWRFLEIGRRLERSLGATGLIRSALSSPAPHAGVLEPLLEIADSGMTYRRRYFAEPQLAPVLDLLLADETNARALAFQLRALAEHLEYLPKGAGAPSPTKEQRLTTGAIEYLAAADWGALGEADETGALPELFAVLDSIDADLRGVSDVLTYYYFTHAEVRVSR